VEEMQKLVLEVESAQVDTKVQLPYNDYFNILHDGVDFTTSDNGLQKVNS
jgi:hypothetical protein